MKLRWGAHEEAKPSQVLARAWVGQASQVAAWLRHWLGTVDMHKHMQTCGRVLASIQA